MADDFGMGYALGADSGGNSGGGFGGSFGEGLWAVIILAILFGRGGFGFGNQGGGFGGGGGGCGYPCATQADLAAGFNNSTVLSSLDDIKLGQANAINYNNQGFAGLNTAVLQGFHGVDNAICNLGFNVQQGFNTLGYQQKDCCCETQRLIERGFCDTGAAIAMQTRDLIDNQNANYRSIMDFMVQEKLSSKDAQIVQLQSQLNLSNQNAVIGARIDAAVADILRRTGHDCPSAAYLVQPPTAINFPTNGCGQVQFGFNGNSCGCGCGCG